MDIRDFLGGQGEDTKLYPYDKDLYYHPSGILSMTIQIYDEYTTQEFSFGITTNGNLKEFLDQIYTGENNAQEN